MKIKEGYEPSTGLYVSHCLEITSPVAFILDRIGSKWSIPILRELFQGSRRTHQLLEALPGMSTKTLMVRLRELEKYGLVQRQVYSEVPPRVEYSLTPKGQELQPIIVALQQVGQRWLQQQESVCPLQLNG